jgi:pyridine nucleotide-disulfide oxidoreductase family protein
MTDIVLIGGGHAHVEVLRSFAEQPMIGVGLTLVTRDVEMVYSGMLPGRIAGHYSHRECVVDMIQLCAKASARLIHREATGLDRSNKRVLVGPSKGCDYDIVSFDVGIAAGPDAIAGARNCVISVKPIANFEAQWPELEAKCLAPGGPKRILMIGGGPAGLELILAIHHRLTNAAGQDGTFRLTLVSGSPLLGDACPRARAMAAQALAARGIELVSGQNIVSIEAGGAWLQDGGFLSADLIFLAIGGQAPAWLAHTGLARDQDGFLAIRPTLQSLSDENVFSVGDCSSMVGWPRLKAGVIAVRQGPILAENLRRRAAGAALRYYRPQKRTLMLIGLGNAEAVASRGALAAKGAWAWRWKQRLDRNWIKRYQP